MKKQTSIILTILFLSFAGTSYAQQPVIPLYSGVAPGSENSKQKEVTFTTEDGQPRIRNVVQPTLTAFLPDKAKANGTAIIVAPGGGFRHLAMEKEGNDVARWLQARGVAAFVLKCRLVDTGATEEEYKKQQAALTSALRSATKDPAAALAQNAEWQKAIAVAVADGQQAVRIVRGRAAEWGIAPNRIGLIGFSAGGILTVGTVLKNEAASLPNFAAPIYGGYTNGAAVAADAPPLFIAVADDDNLAAVSSAQLYLDWRKAELHVYATGGHGFGMTKRGLPVDSWVERFGEWLQVWLEFAAECGALESDEIDGLREAIEIALEKFGQAQGGHQLSENPALRFIELIQAALISGKGHLAALNGGQPEREQSENREVWGWRDGEPQGDRIGWLDGDDVYLQPDAAYRCAQAYGLNGEGLTVTARTLWKRLREAGLLVSCESEERQTIKKQISETRPRVLHLSKQSLSGSSLV